MDLDGTPGLGGRVVVLDGSRLAGQRDWRGLADVVLLTCAKDAHGAVLLDVRGAAFTPTAREVDVLSSALAGCSLVAIASDGNASYGCARMVAMTVELRGSRAAAFQDEARAWMWLEEWLGAEQGKGEVR